MNKYIFFMRFNRTFGPKDRERLKYQRDPEKWKDRVSVFEKTARLSINAQTDKDFEVWAVFNRQLVNDWQHIKQTADDFAKFPEVKVKVEPPENMTLSALPIHTVCDPEYAKYDNMVLINLDSDDMYRQDTIERIKKVELKPGRAMIFMNGYIYDINTGKMAFYEGKGAPGPFWAINCPRHYRSDVDTFLEYLSRFGLDQHHFRITSARYPERMPDGMFMQTISGANIKTHWTQQSTKGHIGPEVGEKKSAILEQFAL